MYDFCKLGKGAVLMQESFDDSTQLLMLLPLINKTIVSAIDIKELRYTKTQLYICLALARYENLTMSQVAKSISSSKEQATRAVAPLVDDGLIERYTDPENRTRIHVQLTQKGKDFMEHCKIRFRNILQSHMEQNITAEDREELSNAIETLIRILSKFN